MLPARAYAGDAGLDLAACERVELAPGERAVVGTGLAVAIPEGYAGFVQPRSGLAARARDLDREHARARRLRATAASCASSCSTPTASEPFVVEPGMRIAQLVVVPVPQVELVEVRRAAGERARRARLRLVAPLMRPSPAIRVSAILRWRGQHPALPAGEAGQGVLAAARAAASNSGESLTDALQRELDEELGIDDDVPLEGPVAIVRVDRADSGRVARSTSSTSSSPATSPAARSRRSSSRDAAVRGHRLFALDELDEIVVHPPIQRFLRRWRPGDPVVYLGSLWAP